MQKDKQINDIKKKNQQMLGKHLVNQSRNHLGLVELLFGDSFIASSISPALKLEPRSSASGFNYSLVMRNPSICLIRQYSWKDTSTHKDFWWKSLMFSCCVWSQRTREANKLKNTSLSNDYTCFTSFNLFRETKLISSPK